MLVLSRHKDESLIIGDNIVVTILGIHGSYVRVGIKASDSVKIYREEIYHKAKSENANENEKNNAKSKLSMQRDKSVTVQELSHDCIA